MNRQWDHSAYSGPTRGDWDTIAPDYDVSSDPDPVVYDGRQEDYDEATVPERHISRPYPTSYHHQDDDSMHFQILHDDDRRRGRRRKAISNGFGSGHRYYSDADAGEQHPRGVSNQGFVAEPYMNFSRRSKSQNDNDWDGGFVGSLSLRELQRTRRILATVRVKKQSLRRKSLRRRDSARTAIVQMEDNIEDEEEMGLPSARVHVKPLSLAERLKLKQMTDTSEYAQYVREKLTEFESSGSNKYFKQWKHKGADQWSNFEIWASHMKDVEGTFGIATASYFRFTRWLIFLNLLGFFITFLVIVIPFMATKVPHSYEDYYDSEFMNKTVNETGLYQQQARNCSKAYADFLTKKVDNAALTNNILSFFTGEEWMEQTVMFYGHYYNRTFKQGSVDFSFDMGLAYLLAMIISFITFFIFILYSSGSNIQDTVMSDKSTTAPFTNSVLCGWDFCITKDPEKKHNIIANELKVMLTEQINRLNKDNLTSAMLLRLYAKRVGITFIVLLILAGYVYLIYFTTEQLLQLQNKNLNNGEKLLAEFLPSIIITVVNFIIPIVFNILVALEQYLPATEIRVGLIRNVILKLSSVGALIVSLYWKLQNEGGKEKQNCPEEGNVDALFCCGNLLWTTNTSNFTTEVKCWENYVGQQFYKLSLLDFAVFLIIFITEFPLRVICDKFGDKYSLIKKFGTMEFDIPQNVLDIVYSQTLCWLGMFFCPLLLVVAILKSFFIFYMKKLSLMKNYSPPRKIYRASRSNSFFITILLLSFIICSCLLGYMVGNIHPSKSCGPFRVYSRENYVFWMAFTDVVSSWPKGAVDFVFFFGTTAFFAPAFIVLCLTIYYYWTISLGQRKLSHVLQEQIRMEGKDKQFLLARVSNIILEDKSMSGMTSDTVQQQTRRKL